MVRDLFDFGLGHKEVGSVGRGTTPVSLESYHDDARRMWKQSNCTSLTGLSLPKNYLLSDTTDGPTRTYYRSPVKSPLITTN